MLLMVSIHDNMHPDCLPLPAALQLFSSEEKHISQQHSVTVYGAPGPEPFAVFSVTAQTTAKQLLDTVSFSGEMKLCPRSSKVWSPRACLRLAGGGRRGKPGGLLPVRGEGPAAEGAQRGEALRTASAPGARGGGGPAGVGLDRRGGIRGEDLPQTQRRGTRSFKKKEENFIFFI